MTTQPEALRLADDLRQGHFEMVTFAADELCRLSAENDALRADAVRYRALRDDEHGQLLPEADLYAGQALDEYIDAAIARAGGAA